MESTFLYNEIIAYKSTLVYSTRSLKSAIFCYILPYCPYIYIVSENSKSVAALIQKISVTIRQDVLVDIHVRKAIRFEIYLLS